MARAQTVEFWAGGQSIPWSSFDVSLRRNEPASWGIKMLDNSARDFSPGEENPHFASLTSRDYPWSTTVDGAAWGPTWLQNDYQFDGNENSNLIQVSGGDFSLDLIKRKDEFMSDVEGSSHEALEEIFTEYSTGYSFGSVPSYEIQQMHRIGCPLDWIRTIFEPQQAWYLWFGAQMRMFQTTFPRAADHVLKDCKDLKLISYRRNMGSVYNTATCERVDGSGGTGVVLEVGKSDGESLGIQEYTFPTPVYVAVPNIKVKRGSVHTFVYYDEYGDPLNNLAPAGSNSLFNGHGVAHSVKFTVQPAWDSGIRGRYMPEYEGIFTGRTTAPTGETLEDYEVTYSDPADVSKHGILRYTRPLVNALIATKAQAEDYVRRWVAEAVRTYISAKVSLLFRPDIFPGDVVSITDYWTKLSGDLFLVETVSHSGSSDSLVTTLELSRPAASE